MTEEITAKCETIFLEVAADTSLFHCVSAYMTRELRENGHDQPEGSLSPHELRNSHAIFAFRGLTIQGMLVVHFHADSGLARLYRLWVVPSARCSGVGRALMTYAEEFIAGRGSRTIELDTGQDLVAAVALYRSMDYKEELFPERSPRSLLFRKHLAAV